MLEDYLEALNVLCLALDLVVLLKICLSLMCGSDSAFWMGKNLVFLLVFELV